MIHHDAQQARSILTHDDHPLDPLVADVCLHFSYTQGLELVGSNVRRDTQPRGSCRSPGPEPQPRPRRSEPDRIEAILVNQRIRVDDPRFQSSWAGDLIVIDGTPVVAWNETTESDGPQVYVARHDGTEWVVLCDAVNVDPSREALNPSLSFDAATSTLFVAFEEYVDGRPEIFVRQLQLGD
jgi:hypothetical protein